MKFDVVNKLQNHIKLLRKKSFEENRLKSNDLNKPVFTEERNSLLNGIPARRLVIFLRGRGCELVFTTGGCSFCGFIEATNLGKKIPFASLMEQLKYSIEQYNQDFYNLPIISLYNDGSILSESEFEFEDLIKIIRFFSSYPSVKKITIESRISDITEAKLKQLKESTHLNLEIAFGFESANPLVRKLCINKNFTNQYVFEICEKMKKYEISPVALIMFKPPFLTESEAMSDMLNSFHFLSGTSVDRIDIELPTIQKNTLMYSLWKKGHYEIAKLWSVIYAISEANKNGFSKQIYISPPNYTVPSLLRSSNCNKCDSLTFEKFNQFNLSQDIQVFRELSCNCYFDWKEKHINQLRNVPNADLFHQRIDALLDSLNIQKSPKNEAHQMQSSQREFDHSR